MTSQTDPQVKELNKQLKSTKVELTNKKRLLRKVKSSIKERKAYLKKQEQDIATAVDIYNIRLTELNADIATIEREKDDCLRELAELQEQIRTANAEKDRLERLNEELKSLSESSTAKLRIDIRSLQAEKKQADDNLKKSKEEAVKLLRGLSRKEKELVNREQILAGRESAS